MPARGRDREMPVPVRVCLPHAALPPGNPRQPKTELQRSVCQAGTSRSSSRRETNVALSRSSLVACQRGSSRLALGRLANVGGALRSQAQTRDSSLAPSIPRPAVDCRLSLSLTLVRHSLLSLALRNASFGCPER